MNTKNQANSVVLVEHAQRNQNADYFENLGKLLGAPKILGSYVRHFDAYYGEEELNKEVISIDHICEDSRIIIVDGISIGAPTNYKGAGDKSLLYILSKAYASRDTEPHKLRLIDLREILEMPEIVNLPELYIPKMLSKKKSELDSQHPLLFYTTTMGIGAALTLELLNAGYDWVIPFHVWEGREKIATITQEEFAKLIVKVEKLKKNLNLY